MLLSCTLPVANEIDSDRCVVVCDADRLDSAVSGTVSCENISFHFVVPLMVCNVLMCEFSVAATFKVSSSHHCSDRWMVLYRELCYSNFFVTLSLLRTVKIRLSLVSLCFSKFANLCIFIYTKM